jgi:hypothetical protein
MAKNRVLLGLFSRVAEFRIDERMIAMGDAQSLGQSMRAVGEVEPLFGESKEVAPLSALFSVRLASSIVCAAFFRYSISLVMFKATETKKPRSQDGSFSAA